ncbi:hypothetical protein BBW65_03675 [Helicobacter enhydrae]|uniref:Prokaryotic metallothionein family protein n=1 Tax=Helicobacter enhydrae TaxID=222136 RepID=A0A1B1U5H9_9HELI|nr:PP0621 family protein [Helicobacter enhydrae]ANV97952.1 hypothetical protein BBW65_03675 [Helicobacter enhydrae]
MLKTLIFLGLLFGVVWFWFLRKPPRPTTPNQDDETMVECHKCQTFISQKEAILSNGHYYCSKNCLLGN